MSRHRDWDVSCKVYIGNLSSNASKYELEDAFSKYGPLRNVWVARFVKYLSSCSKNTAGDSVVKKQGIFFLRGPFKYFTFS
jgi:RNA recognition motif-containing protein